jgi:hypothetical protein
MYKNSNFHLYVALSGRNVDRGAPQPKALPLGWDILGFQPAEVQ